MEFTSHIFKSFNYIRFAYGEEECGLYNLGYDRILNRIFISIEDSLDGDEAACYVKETIRLIEEASPGFSVFVDLRKCDLSVLYNAGRFNAVRATAARKNVGKVVHILNEEARKLHSINPFEGVTHSFTDTAEAEHFLTKD